MEESVSKRDTGELFEELFDSKIEFCQLTELGHMRLIQLVVGWRVENAFEACNLYLAKNHVEDRYLVCEALWCKKILKLRRDECWAC